MGIFEPQENLVILWKRGLERACWTKTDNMENVLTAIWTHFGDSNVRQTSQFPTCCRVALRIEIQDTLHRKSMYSQHCYKITMKW